MSRVLAGQGMTSARTRARMIERLREKGIRDERVLAALAAVPRHIFVEEALASRAYEDTALPLGFAQTISQPYIVAEMTQALEITPEDRVLEIGTGSGYQAAVLAHQVADSQMVAGARTTGNIRKDKAFQARPGKCAPAQESRRLQPA